MVRAGDPCPYCGQTVEAAQNVFYHLVLGLHSGLVCKHCPRCWDDPDNSFIDAVMKWAKERANEDQDRAGQ